MKAVVFVFLSFAGPALLVSARADDLRGTNRYLCSAGSVSACCDDGQCASGTAAELNIPQFVEIDLTAKRVSTTKASGLNRASTIDGMTREDGIVIIHGIENGRAYSFTVVEATGEMSATIAALGCSIAAFGTCTPLPAGK